MMWWDHGMGGWGFALMGLSTVVFWGLLIAVIVLVARYLSRTSQPGPPSPHPTAEDVLAQRFARGEIDAEEYRSRLDTLRGRHDSPTAT
jgi:Predicted membrane protein